MVGAYHTYTGYAGLITGYDNAVSSDYAMSIGGSGGSVTADSSVLLWATETDLDSEGLLTGSGDCGSFGSSFSISFDCGG